MPSPNAPTFYSRLSTLEDGLAAAREVVAGAAERFTGAPDLGLAFLSRSQLEQADDIARSIREATGVRHLLGCGGESIVGTGQEVERDDALSLWLGKWPGATISPMRLEFQRTIDGGSFVGWPDDLPDEWPAGAALLLLGDPYSFPADGLLARMNEDRPGATLIGGMASAGDGPGENVLIVDDQVHNSGAVAVLLHGGIRVEAIVSQGCRPVGRTYVVTKAERNVILELGGKPSLVRLQEVFDEASEAERAAIRQGAHLGLVIDERREELGPGDFLIRNVTGADPNSGAVAIGDWARVGQTVRFHARDAATADFDLNQLATASAANGSPALAALLFTCNGRGRRLFDVDHHDALALRAAFGEIPLAGFFAQGEIGPVGGKNFIHGFTASAAIFRAP